MATKKTNKDEEHVYALFDAALKGARPCINMYWEGYNKVVNKMKHIYVGKVCVGIEYKNHLFNIKEGWHDSEYIIVNMGSMSG